MHKKKLLSFLSLGLASVLVSLSATYAWYSVQAILTAKQISLSLGSTSFLIGWNEQGVIRYSDAINEEQIRNACPEFFEKAELGDVSGMMDYRWKGRGLPELYTLRGQKADQASFLQFELYFLSDAAAEIYFDSTGPIHLEDSQPNWISSLRLSLLAEEEYRLFYFGTSYEPVAFAGPLDIDPQDGYFDAEKDREILYGDYEGEPRYLSPSDNGTSFHYPGVWILDPNSYQPHYEQADAFSSFRYVEGKKNHPLFHLKAKVPTKVVLTLYAEGWDPHLNDSTRGKGFGLDLRFLAIFTS